MMENDIMNNVMYYERNKGLHNTCSIEVLEINNILNIRVSNPIDISEEGTIKNKVKEIKELRKSSYVFSRSFSNKC